MISPLALPTALLLAIDRSKMFRNMGSGFREKQESFNPAELLLWVAVLIAVFMALNGLSKFMSRRDKPRPVNSPRKLFSQLCRVHGLDRRSRRLLKRLAAQHRLPHPVYVFLQPRCFDQAGLGAKRRGQEARIAELRQVLFGNLGQSQGLEPLDCGPPAESGDGMLPKAALEVGVATGQTAPSGAPVDVAPLSTLGGGTVTASAP